jgi:uncharacterized Zn finger protein (UPF0148 family)
VGGIIFRKNCDKCNRPSYSSCEHNEWYCPICNNDLTHYPLFNAMTFERININAVLAKLKEKDQKEYM